MQLKTGPARHAQLLQPSCVRRHWLQAKTKCQRGLQQLCKYCRTCFKFYCMFYFTCDRSFTVHELRC